MNTVFGIAAHPEALNAIVQASECCTIVATEDIVDTRGIILWTHGRRVTAALANRLLDRRLARPLETCLAAEDGITLFTLCTELNALLMRNGPAQGLLGAHASMLLEEVKQLHLHPVAQLLLTTAAVTRPASFSHAVLAMALAGALAASREANLPDTGSLWVQLAMLGGLLHDIGEVYLPPQHLGPAGPLGLIGHKHLMRHPRLAQRLLEATTDYPPMLTRAIGEHHERLDGSGYPARLHGIEVSPLGCLLSVVAMATDILSDGEPAPWTRLRFELQAVPGEFDPTCTELLCDMARRLPECLPLASPPGRQRLRTWNGLEAHLARTRALAHQLQAQQRSALLLDIVDHAVQRLDRLRQAWGALGVWSPTGNPLLPHKLLELELAEDALLQRLQALQRECLLMSTPLRETEKLQLEPLWQGLAETA